MESPLQHDAPASARWGLANSLSLSRLVIAPLCAWSVVEGRDGLALLFYVLAVASDLVDGPIARRRGEVSALGALLDHASDAFFVSLGVAAMAVRGLAPVALPLLIALAFMQYTLDSKALAGRHLRASALGRYNGIAYFVMLGTPLIRNSLGLPWPSDGLVIALGWLLVVSTLASMVNRLLVLLRSEYARD